jgi:enoyl-CoA hydratase/carnithine racemase
MSEAVLSEVQGAVGRITLNRPEAYNAITIELARALERALRELAAEESVHVIVIRGAGGNFSVGGDFTELERLRAQGVDAMRTLFESFGAACSAIASLPVPVIAAVEGYAMAGGFELMQAADIAIVREDAKLADNHTNFGLIPGGGSTQRLPRLAGRQRALGLILTGDRLSGADAAAWGLAYEAFGAAEFDGAVEELVRRLAEKSPEALTLCKRLVYDGLDRDLAAGLQSEIEAVLAHLQSDAATEAFERFATRSAGS